MRAWLILLLCLSAFDSPASKCDPRPVVEEKKALAAKVLLEGIRNAIDSGEGEQVKVAVRALDDAKYTGGDPEVTVMGAQLLTRSIVSAGKNASEIQSALRQFVDNQEGNLQKKIVSAMKRDAKNGSEEDSAIVLEDALFKAKARRWFTLSTDNAARLYSAHGVLGPELTKEKILASYNSFCKQHQTRNEILEKDTASEQDRLPHDLQGVDLEASHRARFFMAQVYFYLNDKSDAEFIKDLHTKILKDPMLPTRGAGFGSAHPFLKYGEKKGGRDDELLSALNDALFAFMETPRAGKSTQKKEREQTLEQERQARASRIFNVTLNKILRQAPHLLDTPLDGFLETPDRLAKAIKRPEIAQALRYLPRTSAEVLLMEYAEKCLGCTAEEGAKRNRIFSKLLADNPTANARLRDAQGRTLLQIAKDSDNKELLSLLGNANTN